MGEWEAAIAENIDSLENQLKIANKLKIFELELKINPELGTKYFQSVLTELKRHYKV